MAFGRSNSLSLNTGAANSLFSQQSTQQQNNPPQAASGTNLFGGAQNTPSQPSGGIFGNMAQNAGGGAFGSTTQQPQQQNTGTSLFGNTGPGQQGGSFFGNMTTQQQPTTGGFGASTSLFGNNPNSTSLFGNRPDNNQSMGGNMFFQQMQNQNRPAGGNSVFGMQSVDPNALNTSLLNASQFRASQTQPFFGKLSMGQGGPTPAQQAAQIGAVRVNYNELRGTTRFADCVDEVKNDFEKVDQMIRTQEGLCRRIQAFLQKHEEDVAALPPSVAVVKEKADGVEMLLAQDAQAVEKARQIADKDEKDFARCQRVAESTFLPALNYRIPGASGSLFGPSWTQSQQTAGIGINGLPRENEYDVDVIGNFFLPLTDELSDTLKKYASNLAEIEGHMTVLESSALARAQQLAARRAGLGGAAASTDDTVEELADTLRGIEQSILGVAGVVGQCREGVTSLAMGRLGSVAGIGGRVRNG